VAARRSSCLWTVPSRMTHGVGTSSSKFSKGLPSTTVKSASFPGSRLPRSLSTPKRPAGTTVMYRRLRWEERHGLGRHPAAGCGARFAAPQAGEAVRCRPRGRRRRTPFSGPCPPGAAGRGPKAGTAVAAADQTHARLLGPSLGHGSEDVVCHALRHGRQPDGDVTGHASSVRGLGPGAGVRHPLGPDAAGRRHFGPRRGAASDGPGEHCGWGNARTWSSCPPAGSARGPAGRVPAGPTPSPAHQSALAPLLVVGAGAVPQLECGAVGLLVVDDVDTLADLGVHQIVRALDLELLCPAAIALGELDAGAVALTGPGEVHAQSEHPGSAVGPEIVLLPRTALTVPDHQPGAVRDRAAPPTGGGDTTPSVVAADLHTLVGDGLPARASRRLAVLRSFRPAGGLRAGTRARRLRALG